MKDQITKLVEEKISGTENFLVEVKVVPGKVIVTLDHPNGTCLDDCVIVNRFLHEKLDESGFFDKHELEVGSPGMEEPLKVHKQYVKRLGQEVGVVTFDGIKHLGILKSVNEEGIDLEETITVKIDNKKEKQQQLISLPFSQIKETRVNFHFDKII